MITNISIVSVFVKDVDESKRFYTDVLGFDAKDDITLEGGYRWCTVVHPNQPELMVNLTIPAPPHPPELVEAMKRALDEGGMHGLGLNVDDCQRTFEELSAKGVEFIQPPSQRPYGTEALCRDNSGNWLVLVQPTDQPYNIDDFTPNT
jgi:catechol 2,3-dioxygenase-like lactoylglutathione lyase family enzyme